MEPIRRGALIFVGIVFLVYTTILRIFIVVCAIFATFVMIGLMIQWTKAAFGKKKAGELRNWPGRSQ